MNKFIMMVGVPGSGKSTFSKELAEKEDGVLISSDQLRLELFKNEDEQSRNTELFEYVHNKIKEELANGKTVIYDATNTNRKRRIHLLTTVCRNYHKVVYYINTPLKQVYEFNQKRDRVVPQRTIINMFNNLHVPIYNEGWDEIHYVYNSDDVLIKEEQTRLRTLIENKIEKNEGYQLMVDLATYFEDYKDILDKAQDSTYHSFSISRHIYYVYDYLHKEYHENDRLMMLWVALFHDVGKGIAKSFTNHKGEPTRYAHFVGHENGSGQIAATILHYLGYEQDFILKVVELVQLHMRLMNAGDSGKQKLRKFVSEEVYNKLELFHIADNSAK